MPTYNKFLILAKKITLPPFILVYNLYKYSVTNALDKVIQ